MVLSPPNKEDMPPVGGKHAPAFDGSEPRELNEFFEEFERLATRCGLDAAEKSKMVVKYVDLETRRLWKAMDGYGQDYNLMKTDILASC
jgi:hypothetical protein